MVKLSLPEGSFLTLVYFSKRLDSNIIFLVKLLSSTVTGNHDANVGKS